MLQIKINTRGLNRRLTKASRGIIMAQKLALNDTLRGMRTDTSREVRADVNLPAKAVKSTFTLQFATTQRLEACLISTGKSVPLVHYGARPKRPVHEGGRRPKRGVSVLVKRERGRKTISGSFVARMKSGHLGVFRRKGPARRPIKQLYGPSVPNILSNQPVLTRIKAKAEDRLKDRMIHHSRRQMERAFRR